MRLLVIRHRILFLNGLFSFLVFMAILFSVLWFASSDGSCMLCVIQLIYF